MSRPEGKRPVAGPRHMWDNNIVTCIPNATQRLDKHIPATNVLNNRTPIARQWSCKHDSLTSKTVFSVWYVPRGDKKAQSEEATEYRTLVGRELGRVLKMAVEGDGEEVARKELGGEKKTSYVI
jgi:hypothetical protein